MPRSSPKPLCFINKMLRDSEKTSIREEVCFNFEAKYPNETDGNKYCILHYPGQKDEKEFDKAYKAKKELNDYNFQWTCFPNSIYFFKDIDTKINFSNCFFNGGVHFHSNKIAQPVDFYHSQINGELEIRDVTFCSEINFQESRIQGEFSIQKTRFEDSANFSVLKVCGYVFINKSTFDQPINFDLATFCRNANFDDCEFNKASFNRTRFFGESSFDDAIFNLAVRFDYAKFYKFSGFRKTQFKNICVFDECYFFHETFFERAVFGNVAHFINTNFASENRDDSWNHGGYFHLCRFNSYAFFDGAKFKFAAFYSCEF